MKARARSPFTKAKGWNWAIFCGSIYFCRFRCRGFAAKRAKEFVRYAGRTGIW